MTTGRRSATPSLLLLAAVSCLASDLAVAETVKIKNQPGTIAITYDDAVWSATRQGVDLNFACKADACGGTTSTCHFAEILPEGGFTSPDFTKELLALLDYQLLARFEARAPGSKPEIVESAAERIIGILVGVFASARATIDGVLARHSYFYIDTYYIVVVIVCYAPEDHYEIARVAHDSLTAATRLPRPAQPDPQ